MRKVLVITLVFSLILVGISSVGLAFGGPKGRPRARDFDGRRPFCNNPLDLTEEQAEEMEELQEKYFDERMEIIEQLRDKNLEFRKLIFSDEEGTKVSEIELKAKIDKLRGDLLDLQEERFEEMKNILSEDQIEEFKDLFEARENMRAYGRRRGMHGRRW